MACISFCSSAMIFLFTASSSISIYLLALGNHYQEVYLSCGFDKLLVRFLHTPGLEIFLPQIQNNIRMSALFCKSQCLFPLEQFDPHCKCLVHGVSGEENILSLCRLVLEEREFSKTTFFVGNIADSANVLYFGDLAMSWNEWNERITLSIEAYATSAVFKSSEYSAMAARQAHVSFDLII